MMPASDKIVPTHSTNAFSADSLRLDGPEAVRSITEGIRDQIQRRLRRRGAIIGLSGGIDSSVTAALCVAALGPSNVLAVLMPEKDSDPESVRLGRLVADTYGIRHVVEDIAPTLSAAGCYLRRDGAIRELFPDYGPDWSCKVVLSKRAARQPLQPDQARRAVADGRAAKRRVCRSPSIRPSSPPPT
jgi:NH3-dependent NAD+ synthetase